MYRKNKPQKSQWSVNNAYEGESLEHKIKRIVNNKEPITDGAPMIYTERKDGVQKAYDIRTDRWEVAVDAMDKVTKSNLARREMRIGEKTYDTMTPEQQQEFNKKFPTNKYAQQSKKEGGA